MYTVDTGHSVRFRLAGRARPPAVPISCGNPGVQHRWGPGGTLGHRLTQRRLPRG